MSAATAWILGLLLLVHLAAATAQPLRPRDEGVLLLQKAAQAAERLSYSGVYVYRSGAKTETTRIVHLAEGGERIERLETLDGSPREVLLVNDEVKCFLPESRLLVIEQRSNRRSFPSLLPVRLGQLTEYYVIRQGGKDRVAGFESQRLVLEPRDAWRYGHRFWLERESGLLLKAEVFDAREQVLESLAFTELRFGIPTRAEVKANFSEKTAIERAWQIRQARARELREDSPWVVRIEAPGFRRQAAMVRTVSDNQGQSREMLHWIYSDGLAAFSIFIAPLAGDAGNESGVETLGALSIARRTLGEHQIVVVGDVPPALVRAVAEGIGVRP